MILSSAAMDAHHFPLSLLSEELEKSTLWEDAPFQLQLGTLAIGSKRLVPDVASTRDDLVGASSNLADTYSPEEEETESQQRKQLASDQVALDLFLSSQVVRPKPFQVIKDEAANPLLDAEGRQVIGSFREVKEPPPVSFPFFEVGESVQEGIGKSTRVLLGEWDVGEDPFMVTFMEHFKETSRRPTPRAESVQQPQSQPAPQRPVFSQFTQPSFSQPAESQSSQAGPSTQVLPGRHGGRPPSKPPRKKRAGGF